MPPHRGGQPGEAAWEGATEETSLGTGERAREASPLSSMTRCSLAPNAGHSRPDSEGGTHRGWGGWRRLGGTGLEGKVWAEPAGWGQNALMEEKRQGEGGRGPHGEKQALPNSQRILSAREAWHSAGRNTGAPSLSGSQPGQDAKGSGQSCRKKLSDGLEASIPKPAVLRGFLHPDHTWRITGHPRLARHSTP